MKEFGEAWPFNKIKLTKKIGIHHSIFEVNQTLSWLCEQSGSHIKSIQMEQNQTF